ncbi:hypothetical protein B0T11DRAFT_94234 [Plectosphaerella cucumerina]|uniref:Uncharacterized protein n=1 Tax=Plectosphaerella cucumerina TaxID=40658 RepID=A0A8K0X5H5_9PEZI|nr:hypothetical protein B0T11DRAFT_94234 [Plectosphaerella cucumerina]
MSMSNVLLFSSRLCQLRSYLPVAHGVTTASPSLAHSCPLATPLLALSPRLGLDERYPILVSHSGRTDAQGGRGGEVQGKRAVESGDGCAGFRPLASPNPLAPLGQVGSIRSVDRNVPVTGSRVSRPPSTRMHDALADDCRSPFSLVTDRFFRRHLASPRGCKVTASK